MRMVRWKAKVSDCLEKYIQLLFCFVRVTLTFYGSESFFLIPAPCCKVKWAIQFRGRKKIYKKSQRCVKGLLICLLLILRWKSLNLSRLVLWLFQMEHIWFKDVIHFSLVFKPEVPAWPLIVLISGSQEVHQMGTDWSTCIAAVCVGCGVPGCHP